MALIGIVRIVVLFSLFFYESYGDSHRKFGGPLGTKTKKRKAPYGNRGDLDTTEMWGGVGGGGRGGEMFF